VCVVQTASTVTRDVQPRGRTLPCTFLPATVHIIRSRKLMEISNGRCSPLYSRQTLWFWQLHWSHCEQQHLQFIISFLMMET